MARRAAVKGKEPTRRRKETKPNWSRWSRESKTQEARRGAEGRPRKSTKDNVKHTSWK